MSVDDNDMAPVAPEGQPEPDSPRRRQGRIARTWRALWSPSAKYTLGGLMFVGFVLGVIFWGGFNWSMELSNTETFCISCHEMEQNVFREYQQTAHYTNPTGVRATCPDCHVPKEWFHKVVRKVRATAELYHHFMGTVSTAEKFDAKRLVLAKSVWNTMKSTDSRECRNCHNFEYMDFSTQEPRSSKAHEEALTKGGTCIDCHKGIAHRLPAGAKDAAKEFEGHKPTASSGILNKLYAFVTAVAAEREGE